MCILRNKLFENIGKDLFGPGCEQIWGGDEEKEIITESPEKVYSVGVLYPPQTEDCKENIPNEQNKKDETTEVNELVEEDEAVEAEQSIKNASGGDDTSILFNNKSFKPSSIGISFKPVDFLSIKVQIKAAVYKKVTSYEQASVRILDDIRILLHSDNDAKISSILNRYGISYSDDLRYFRFSDNKSFDREVRDRFIVEIIDLFGSSLNDSEIKNKMGKRAVELLQERGLRREDSKYTYSTYLLKQLHLFVLSLSRLEEQKNGHVRKPIEKFFEASDLGDGKKIIIDTDHPALKLGYQRRNYRSQEFITLFLCNDTPETETFFQNEICVIGEVTDLEKDTSCFDDESLNYEMLYRNKKQFAIGHNCSVIWDNNGYCDSVRTTFLPHCEAPSMEFTIQPLIEELDEKTIADACRISSHTGSEPIERSCRLLNFFIDNYASWIKDTRLKAPELSSSYSSIGSQNLDKCSEAVSRMKQAVGLIETDQLTWKSFQLAHQAIMMIWERKNVKAGREFDAASVNWRPFQLGFILLCLESIVRPDSDERQTCDLLWFPTGGGKTEAYLFLTAFTIFHRLLTHGDNSAGTSVIMRYTLRLLAAQQFERACELICACEKIRLETQELRNYPQISIGLWIGAAGVPNTCADARSRKNEANRNGNPLPFLPKTCPWCGTELTPDDYIASQNDFLIRCHNENCYFSDETRSGPDSLPIQIIDELLYKSPPSLLFSTVDKFAMLTWKPDAGNFFGRNDNAPPDLIIQDELHLINEELGTMVGLYEGVIAELSCNNGVYPKVIASTATVKNAAVQCKRLYAVAKTFQFPPSGISAEDSYFATESKDPGRLYVGVMSNGLTMTTTYIRLMASVLFRAYNLDKNDFEAYDLYYTLVAYFNSLKELGMTETLVATDIRERIQFLARQNLQESRLLRVPEILCSRVSYNDIVSSLKKLTESKSNQPYCPDIVLSSNMLSVGIDVDRFGVMVVNGHPKKNAEFIQATSRVGRKRAGTGIVFSVYNGFKPRDRSYFEVFQDYIQNFYKYVEPTTVTPFTISSLKKGLHSVVLAILRQKDRGLRENGSLQQIANRNGYLFDEIEAVLEDRIRRAYVNDQRLTDELVRDLKQELKKLLNDLLSGINSNNLDSYGTLNHNGDNEHSFFQKPGKRLGKYKRETMTSMRNVDVDCKIEILN